MPISTLLAKSMPSQFEEAVDEMLPRLFALGDDVDAGVFLDLDRQQRGVALAGQLLALIFHGAHSRFGSASQSGFGSDPAMVVGNSMGASRTALSGYD